VHHDYALEIFKAVTSLVVAALTLGATWWIGNRISATWNLRQKRNELNLAALGEFHSLYGEFKEVVRVWRLAKRKLDSPVTVPEGERWRLLVRACAIESKCEALVLRLTAERILSTKEQESIGLFRQAIQTLRESIREDADCPIGSRREEYKLLNQLAPEIAQIASAEVPAEVVNSDVAKAQLLAVVNVNSEKWKERVKAMRQVSPPESDEDA
jgi:hypothetical protein